VRPSAATKRDERFWIIRAEPEFRPRDYASTFAALQLPWSAKLFDLTPARLISADLFDQLAAAWTAPPDVVPRLGILLSFERWVMLRETIAVALQPLAVRGVRVGIFYDEQAWGGGLATWFSHGELVHNVPAVIDTLAHRWHPSSLWPLVIDTLALLARTYTATAELPALLTEIAGLALSCGGAVQATTLAREALYHLPEMPPSATRGKALRELGAALIGRGQIAAGVAHLDEAIAVAAEIQDPRLGASALAQSGLCALNHGDYPNAEWRFRAAIVLLSPSPWQPHLLAQAHHSLAVALMHQGSDEAEHHAVTALELRLDPQSHLAEEDRILLSRLRDARTYLN
jgi:tetratricopeptide (TPR) repeat protein